MIALEHGGKVPRVDDTAYVAPNAVLCGEVTVGPHSRVLFGAVLTAETGPVTIGVNCIVMEHAVVRGTRHHPTRIGDHVLIGPHAHLTGCTIEDNVFIATGSAIFNGAHVGARSTVRINGIVHIGSVLAPDTSMPIGWIAIGDPAELFPPAAGEEVLAALARQEFSKTVFALDRPGAGESIMPELTRRYAAALGRHREDRILS